MVVNCFGNLTASKSSSRTRFNTCQGSPAGHWQGSGSQSTHHGRFSMQCFLSYRVHVCTHTHTHSHSNSLVILTSCSDENVVERSPTLARGTSAFLPSRSCLLQLADWQRSKCITSPHHFPTGVSLRKVSAAVPTPLHQPIFVFFLRFTWGALG